jgi:DNA-binding response OmpR family regulator
VIKSEPAKILIADDEDDTRQFLYDFLQQLGHKVTAVGNGKEVLKIAPIEFPDVILLDVMMPEMSGLEVCQKLKEIPIIKEIPVIFVTAKATINDQITGLMIGAHDYINKPYRITELTARLNSALRVKRLQDELTQEKNISKINNFSQDFYQILLSSKQTIDSLKEEIKSEKGQEKLSLLEKQITTLLGLINN